MDEFIDYFKVHRNINYIGDLKWAHAVNSRELLQKAVSDSGIDFLEVDISLSYEGIPIPAHYSQKSDITFETLLKKVKQSNKGLKLDFKNEKTITPCLHLLAGSNLEQPVILNADILSVQDAPDAEINPRIFIEESHKYFPKGLLSLGWRTTHSPKSSYTDKDINEMLAVCQGLKNITFPVRASMLPFSWGNIRKLIEINSYTLTIWNSESTSEDLKNWIQKNTSVQKCFYDLG